LPQSRPPITTTTKLWARWDMRAAQSLSRISRRSTKTPRMRCWGSTWTRSKNWRWCFRAKCPWIHRHSRPSLAHRIRKLSSRNG
jgi:hypothetical protein